MIQRKQSFLKGKGLMVVFLQDFAGLKGPTVSRSALRWSPSRLRMMISCSHAQGAKIDDFGRENWENEHFPIFVEPDLVGRRPQFQGFGA